MKKLTKSQTKHLALLAENGPFTDGATFIIKACKVDGWRTSVTNTHKSQYGYNEGVLNNLFCLGLIGKTVHEEENGSYKTRAIGASMTWTRTYSLIS
jgi:hypothetical protein